MTLPELTAALTAEAESHRRRRIRRHASPARMERAAKLVFERMNAVSAVATHLPQVTSVFSDDSMIDGLVKLAIEQEPSDSSIEVEDGSFAGIGTTIALYILQAVFTWAIRRAMQIWRERHVAESPQS